MASITLRNVGVDFPIYNARGRLYRFDLESRTSTPIDTGNVNANNNDHVLSFDGKLLGLSHHSQQHGGRSIVFTVPIDGGTPRQVTPTGPSYLHGFSPDGRWLVYTGQRNGNLDIYKIPIDGGDPVRIIDRVAVKPVISPDGKWIAFQTGGDQPGQGPKLGIIPFEGGQPLKLLAVKLTQYRWSADGKSILYLDDTEGVSNIWSQAVDGGPPKQLTKITTDQIFSFDWSRDGKLMACSRGVVTTDVVLIKDKGREQKE